MKILFIKLGEMIVEPIGVMYLSGMLKKYNHQTYILKTDDKRFKEKLKEINPDIVGYSITTGLQNFYIKINNEVKRILPETFSIMGGPHPTYFPEIIEENFNIDGICIGEGEYALLELVNKLQKKEDFTDIPNLQINLNGKIFKNAVRNWIRDLDILPFPDRELIYSYNRFLKNQVVKRFLTSRGCPFKCSYCYNTKYNKIYEKKGGIVRIRSIDNLINEIKQTRDKYCLKFVKFADDIFGWNEDYLKEFTDIYLKEINLPFECNIRPNIINSKMVEYLKKAGCVCICTAVESSNDRIRNEVLNRNISNQQLIEACRIIKSYGINLYTQNIIGNPSETLKEAVETLKFNIQNKVNFAECFILHPYPGTMIYKYSVDHNFFDGKINSLKQSYWISSPLIFKNQKEKHQVENLHKFFGFVNKYPIFLPIIMSLIKLPPNKLFVLFNRAFDFIQIRKVVVIIKFSFKDFSSSFLLIWHFIKNFVKIDI